MDELEVDLLGHSSADQERIIHLTNKLTYSMLENQETDDLRCDQDHEIEIVKGSLIEACLNHLRVSRDDSLPSNLS